nr:MAG TPA: hypothetical protein [Caudoviricetes sp.]
MWSINPFHSCLNTYLDLWIISSLNDTIPTLPLSEVE